MHSQKWDDIKLQNFFGFWQFCLILKKCFKFDFFLFFLQHLGYTCDTPIHPFNLNCKNENKSKHMDRPEWSVYGRMAEKTENVAFRRKFFDWPDPVDLKVKTVEAKVHAQVQSFYNFYIIFLQN